MTPGQARAADFDYATNGQLHPGDRVLVFGREGIVETVAFSVATGRHLVTVAFDPRMRITYDQRDVVLLERGAA